MERARFGALSPPTVAIPDRLNGYLDRRWTVERRLQRSRWIAAPLLLLLAPLFPSVPPLAAIGLAAGLVAGNALIETSLRRPPSFERLRRVRWAGTFLEWLVALGAVVAARGAAENPLPAVLVALLLLDGARFGTTGLRVATAASIFTAVGLSAAPTSAPPSATGELLEAARWVVIFIAVAIVADGWLGVADAERRSADARWADEHAISEKLRRQVECPLTEREAEVLGLLARGNLTNKHLSALLGISDETLKTHITHISRKLGVHGRAALVAAAREHGLLDDTPRPQGSGG